MKLTEFKVLTFDCYGTLIDWESGIWDALQALIHHNDRNDITRQVALEAFAKTESAQEAETPGMLYPNILRKVHRQLANHFDMTTTDELDKTFGVTVPHWPAFPDSADALRMLHRHFKLVILSNIHNDGIAASMAKLGVTFDAVYTAEQMGAYKPTQANFDFMLEHLPRDLGLQKHEILHTAQSLFHDHVPAKNAGLANAWIDRQGLATSENWGATARVENRPEVDFTFPSMMTMAEAVDLEAS